MLIATSYGVPIPEIWEVGFLRILSASSPMPPELHQGYYELLYIEAGEKSIFVGEDSFDLHGGEMLLIPPGVSHGQTTGIQNRSTLIYVIFRDPKEMPDFLHLTPEQREVLSEKLSACRHIINTNEATRQALQVFAQDVKRDDLFSAPRTNALFYMLLDAIMSNMQADTEAMPEYIRNVIDYIENNRSFMPSLPLLAKESNLSEAHFKQKFKQITGVPPAEYVARRHVTWAEEALIHTDKTIADIAASLGFSGCQHFTRQFKRYIGISPTEYRIRSGQKGTVK